MKKTFEDAHKEKFTCPNCKCKQGITVHFQEMNGDGEQGLNFDACKKCGKKPSPKQLELITGLPIKTNK